MRSNPFFYSTIIHLINPVRKFKVIGSVVRRVFVLMVYFRQVKWVINEHFSNKPVNPVCFSNSVFG